LNRCSYEEIEMTIEVGKFFSEKVNLIDFLFVLAFLYLLGFLSVPTILNF